MPTPKKELVQKALKTFKIYANYEYFFNNLKSADWLEHLWEAKMFSDPPPLKREGEYIQFLVWPESRYLARIASLKPDLVCKIIFEMADTDNVRVYEDLADATLQMPPPIAARLIKKIKKWALSRYHLLLPEKLGSLVAHLAKGGQIDEALELATILLEVLPDPKREIEHEKNNLYLLPPQPIARFEKWVYEQIVKNHIPVLVEAAGMRALILLCDILESAVHLSQRRNEVVYEDYSYIWRPAIEDNPQNHTYSIKDVLVPAVRDAAETIARTDVTKIPEIILLFEKRPWKIFHRIALHILRLFPDTSHKILTAQMMDRELFDDISMTHEYALLLGKHFGKLSEEQENVIFNWIDEGPDLTDYAEFREKTSGNRPSKEELVDYRETWQRDHLVWFKEHLSGKWKERYELLIRIYGEPAHTDFARYSSGTWVGPRSPKSSDEIEKMSVDLIIDFLGSWQPSGESMTSSPEGFGRMLSSVIAKDPVRFSTEADKFIGLDPTYVRACISGLEESLKQKKKVKWSAILKLCIWVVKQPREIPDRDISIRDIDPDWGWTRRHIANLLEMGVQKGIGQIRINKRKEVWKILYILSKDPDPSPETEDGYKKSKSMDPATLAINSVRGEAMNAVILYALWIRRHLQRLPDKEINLNRGLEAMSEVREVLEEHLDTSKDSSLAIRSVYGRWFPWLVLLDPVWSKNHITEIFPTDPHDRAYKDAAWEAYLYFCAPYNNVFDILGNQYKNAVEHLGEIREGEKRLADPDQRLAEHLMTFYWRGKLEMDEPEGLFNRFWNEAPATVRGHAIEFIGRSLKNTVGKVPPEVLLRLRNLWETRHGEAEKEPGKHSEEMGSFSWWFYSEKFDDKWAINQMMRALEISGKTQSDNLIMERLAVLVDKMPKEAIQCLELIARHDREGWSILGWRDYTRTILTKAFQSSDPKIREVVKHLVNYLLSRRYYEYQDLLSRYDI